jgi:leucyl aminopeptidase
MLRTSILRPLFLFLYFLFANPHGQYCDIPYIETKCGYACSDHASASKAGYASAFVIESAFELSDNHIHTVDDKISYLSFDHMLQHARMTLAFAYELAFTDFATLANEADEMEDL